MLKGGIKCSIFVMKLSNFEKILLVKQQNSPFQKTIFPNHLLYVFFLVVVQHFIMIYEKG